MHVSEAVKHTPSDGSVGGGDGGGVGVSIGSPAQASVQAPH
jgi:hypothetical protein